MALKQYNPTDKDRLTDLRIRLRRLGVLYKVTHKEIKELEAKMEKEPEPEPKHWWSNLSWKR